MAFDYRHILKTELERRQASRPSYSLHAFARDLKISAPQLSAVLAGKKGVSKSKARIVAKSLGLSKQDATLFEFAVAAVHARSRTEKEAALKKLKRIENSNTSVFSPIKESRFQVIADWYNLALLQLAETHNFRWDVNFISKRLGISSDKVMNSLKALESTGLIAKVAAGFYKTDEFIKTDDVPSPAIRLNHLQLIQKAQAALESDAIEDRDFSSVTVAIDRTRLPQIKEWLRIFREEFCVEASKGNERDEVYSLNIQFFKVSQ